MGERLTFKQYLVSKDVLREAIKKTPKQTKTYNINKYCNFVVGEAKIDRQIINLKPNTIISVNWLYEDIDNPTAIKVSFDGLKNVDPLDEMIPAWNSKKIQKWLIKNSD